MCQVLQGHKEATGYAECTFKEKARQSPYPHSVWVVLKSGEELGHFDRTVAAVLAPVMAYRIAGYFRAVPIFVIFVTQRKPRKFPPPKITTPPKETVTCAAQERRPSVASERMALFRYQFVQLMPMMVIPSTLFTTATTNGSVRIPFSRWHDSSSPISTSHMPCKRGSL